VSATSAEGGVGRVGCYPGSFNPPTVAHLAVAEAARSVGRLDRIDLIVSRVALGKEVLAVPAFEDRVALLHDIARTRSWLGVVATDACLIVDLARGYDAVVMGADKWRQVNDPAWYGGDLSARDAALGHLPQVLLAPRAGDALEGMVDRPEVTLLRVAEDHASVSATAIRDDEPGARTWMLPEAAAFDSRTHAWSDPARYRPDHR
jgi:hypothetical protein